MLKDYNYYTKEDMNKEVLSQDLCATPASRVYLALQCAYMFPEKQPEYLEMTETHLEDFITACPSATEIATKIRDHITSNNLYKGLKGVQELIEYETYVLQTFNEGIEEMQSNE